jgi:hypothetical protein
MLKSHMTTFLYTAAGSSLEHLELKHYQKSPFEEILVVFYYPTASS